MDASVFFSESMRILPIIFFCVFMVAAIWGRLRWLPRGVSASRTRMVIEGALMLIGFWTFLWALVDFQTFIDSFLTNILLDVVMVTGSGFLVIAMLRESIRFLSRRDRSEAQRVRDERIERATRQRQRIRTNSEESARRGSPLSSIGSDARSIAEKAFEEETRPEDDRKNWRDLR